MYNLRVASPTTPFLPWMGWSVAAPHVAIEALCSYVPASQGLSLGCSTYLRDTCFFCSPFAQHLSLALCSTTWFFANL